MLLWLYLRDFCQLALRDINISCITFSCFTFSFFKEFLHFSLEPFLHVKWCVQCILFWPALKSVLEFCFTNSASFFLSICSIYLSFCLVLVSCQMQCFAQLQSGKTSVTHTPASCWCFSCSKSGGGMDPAESWSPCLVVFLGLPQFPPASLHPGRVEGREGMKAPLAAASNLFLVAPGHPARPGYGFTAMDLAEWRSWSEGKAVRWVSVWGLQVGMSRHRNRREQEKCLYGGELLIFRKEYVAEDIVRERLCTSGEAEEAHLVPPLQGTAALRRTG